MLSFLSFDKFAKCTIPRESWVNLLYYLCNSSVNLKLFKQLFF